MTFRAILASACLALAAAPCSRAAAADSTGNGWAVLEAPKAGLRLTTPRGWRLSETAVPTTPERPSPVVLVRVFAGQEPPLSMTADVEIYAQARPSAPLDEWAGQQLQLSTLAHAKLETTAVGRTAALAHRVHAGSEEIAETFAFVGGKALRIAIPARPSAALAGEHVLQSLSEAPQADAPAHAMDTNAGGVVHPFVLSPSDVPLRPDYSLVLRRAFENLQTWYRDATSNKMTFRLASVGTVTSDQNSAWFIGNPAGSDSTQWFWRNSFSEGFRLTGGGFSDPLNSWMYYVDVDPTCEQIWGAVTGVGIEGRPVIRGLTSQRSVATCPGSQTGTASACIWLGVEGQQLGITFGLTVPPGCFDNSTSTPCPDSIMGEGYINYPRAKLRAEEQALLVSSPFLTVSDLARPQYSCDKLFAPPELFKF
jgi:hypothetical protein